MSIITLARLARPLRTRCFSSGINITQEVKDAHNRETSFFQHFYETQQSELRKELKSLQRAKIKWERQDLQEGRDEQKRRTRRTRLERKRAQKWQERVLERSGLEAQLMSDKIKLLHEVARLRRDVSATSSLDIIDTLYRRSLAPPDPQLVLSGIINANSAYPASRRLEISLLDRTLEPDEVDRAGHDLYHACLPLLPQDTQPVTLREGQLALPAAAAFFALAHWAQAGISVEYVLRSGEVAASVNECSKP